MLRPAGAACDIGAFEVATPTATTEGTSAIGFDRATISGLADNPDLTGGTVFFEFGPTLSYGSRTDAQPIAAATRGDAFAATLADLAPATTYHYRAVVTNAVGTVVGADRTFTTGASAPPDGAKGGGQAGGSQTGGPGVAPSKRGTLTVKPLGGLRFRVGCANAPCRGVLLATAHAQGSKRVTVIAKAPLKLAAGAAQKVALKLTRGGERLTALPGKVPIEVRAKLGAGASVPTPLHLKLP